MLNDRSSKAIKSVVFTQPLNMEEEQRTGDLQPSYFLS